jgi:hypothetical protein
MFSGWLESDWNEKGKPNLKKLKVNVAKAEIYRQACVFRAGAQRKLTRRTAKVPQNNFVTTQEQEIVENCKRLIIACWNYLFCRRTAHRLSPLLAVHGSVAAGILTGDVLLRLPLDDFWPNFHLAPTRSPALVEFYLAAAEGKGARSVRPLP